MKLINPSVELIQQQPGLVGMYKHIEKCARTCYKSENKITEDSYKKMYDNLVQRGHLAMLEHGTVYLKKEVWSLLQAQEIVEKFGKYSKYNLVGWILYITTNMRVIIENHLEDYLEYICEPTEFHERRITLKFITNIGVTREGNRHRVNSIAEESTRYCNYSDANKFGEDITFIKPTWISWEDLGQNNNCKELVLKDAIDVYSINKQVGTYLDNLIQSEEAYKELINLGWSPQQAREVLPLATKSEVVYTAFASDWKHWFDLRLAGTTGKPHPNMKEIAELAQQELVKNNLWNLIYPENERN